MLRRLVTRRADVARLPASPPSRGRAVISYLRDPVGWADGDPRLDEHTNRWESREIARIVAGLGFDVEAIDFSHTAFRPRGDYDVVLAIEGALVRLQESTGASTGLLHLTGSHPAFQNAAERARIAELEQRSGIRCVPRRVVTGEAELDAALATARACTLLGNETTLATYPAAVRDRIRCLAVTASPIGAPRDEAGMEEAGDAFLWFFGSGAVHKGLDRVLEAFAHRPALTLHVVGNIAAETDFIQAYERELTALPNITYHGFLRPSSDAFAQVLSACSYVLAPTCSEGMSPAVASSLVAGLYPVISRQTGITLPPGCGRYLGDCSVQDVGDACDEVAALNRRARTDQMLEIQRDAAQRYARSRFTESMRAHLEQVLI